MTYITNWLRRCLKDMVPQGKLLSFSLISLESHFIIRVRLREKFVNHISRKLSSEEIEEVAEEGWSEV